MGWADLLSTDTELTLPWTGQRSIVGRRRKWKLTGALPTEHGWHRFSVDGGRRARWLGEGFSDPDFAQDRRTVRGYLLGDRLIPDTCAVHPNIRRAFDQTEQVWLVEGGLDRFARVLTVRSGGRLIFYQQEFPEGPEMEVLEIWQDRGESIDHILGVSPALQLSFQWLVWQRRLVAERRRLAAEVARCAAVAEARAQRHREVIAAANEAARQRAEILERHRQARQVRAGDLESVLEAALSVSGSELLDHRPNFRQGEIIVQFRFRRRRFECVVNSQTLQIIDSGICLTDESTGEKGDARFTLESLPPVIGQAMDQGVLHVFRHVR